MSDVLAGLIPDAGAGDPAAVAAALRPGSSAPSSAPAPTTPVKNKGGRPKGRKDSAPRKPRGGSAPASSAPAPASSEAPASGARSSAPRSSAPRMSASDFHAPGIGGGIGTPAADPAVIASLTMPLALAFKALGGFAARMYGEAAALDDDATEALASAWAPCLAPMLGGASSPWTAALMVTGAVVAPRALAVASARRVQRAVPAEASPVPNNSRDSAPAPAPPPVTGIVLDLSAS